MVETVSDLKIAVLLDNAWNKVCSRPLDVLIQVNTSGEERSVLSLVNFVLEKGGVAVADLVGLYKAVSENCPHLNLCGLMTIGRYGYDQNLGPNPDFSVHVAFVHWGCSVCTIAEIRSAMLWACRNIRFN